MLFSRRQLELELETSPPWWPDLAEKLASDKWTSLRDVFGLTKESYSTDFFLKSKIARTRETVNIGALLRNNVQCTKSIEFLSAEAEKMLAKNGLNFYSQENFLRLGHADIIFSALEKICAIPRLFKSTDVLAKNIVLLKPKDNFSDTSYSSPKIPFTIFISIPQDRVENIELRVAESIIHECMHLQLTLLEERAPIIASHKDRHFSPWKGEWRNSSGIFHAMYVFCVILHWLQSLESNRENIKYIKDRKSQILSEVSQIAKIEESDDLTSFGKTIAKRILNYLPTDDAI